jgi:glycosyltransferase involved in cell wall biosynthesis
METTPMRVAIVYRLDRPGGVKSCILALIKGLNGLGLIPDILWDIPPNPALLKNAGLQARYKHLRFPFPTSAIERLPESLRYLSWMENLIDGEKVEPKYDFYYIFFNGFLVPASTPHVRYLSGPPLLPQLECIPAGLQGFPIRLFKKLYKKKLRRFRPVYEFHRDSRYVINSHYTAGLFKEAYGIDLQVVHPPVDLSRYCYAEDDLPHRDTLTFFSRMVDYKRPEKVLELAFRHPGLRCVIMGSVSPNRKSYFRSLQERAKQAGRPDIIFLDTPSDQKVKEELARTRFFVFPAQNEHFGMATPEAIASGAIPYVHDSGGQREIIPDPRLRFQDEIYFEKFETLLACPESEMLTIRRSLAAHVRNYSEEVFLSKMLAFLNVPVK